MIKLTFCNVCTYRTCFLSGKEFTQDTPLAFFYDGDYKKPVSPKQAIYRGFTISQEDLKAIQIFIRESDLKLNPDPFTGILDPNPWGEKE